MITFKIVIDESENSQIQMMVDPVKATDSEKWASIQLCRAMDTIMPMILDERFGTGKITVIKSSEDTEIGKQMISRINRSPKRR